MPRGKQYSYYARDKKPILFFLQETQRCDDDATFWSNQCGEKLLFSHSSNCSGGVAKCFSRCPGKVATYKADDFDHWLAVVLNIEDRLYPSKYGR